MVKTIKTRESTRDIKVLDKAGFLTNHLRQATVKSKEMISSDQEEGTNQYAINQVTARSKQMAGKTSSKIQQKARQTIRKKIQAMQSDMPSYRRLILLCMAINFLPDGVLRCRAFFIFKKYFLFLFVRGTKIKIQCVQNKRSSGVGKQYTTENDRNSLSAQT